MTIRFSLAAATFVGFAGTAFAQDTVTLRMHSFSGTQAPEYEFFVEPFAERLDEESGGSLQVQYYPSMQLGGDVADLVQQLEDGVVDIVLMVPGFVPGRFSGLEGMELPFVNAGTAAGQTASLWAYSEQWLMDTDFAGVKLLHMHATDASVFHTSTAVLDTMDAFDGLKIRAPGRYVGEAIAALGATPVGLGFSEVYEAMERGQIDGFATNWAIIPPYKLNEVSSFHLDVPVYQGTIMALMRQESYDGLSDEHKAIIDSGISVENSVAVSANIDALTAAAKEEITATGGTIYGVSADELARFLEAVQPVYATWVEEMTERGQPGHEMFDSLLEITAANGRE